jgi:MYXO-CTERM domain-containing protein
MRRPLPLLAFSLASLAAVAHAQPRPTALSAVEHALGASPVHRVAGHGRLTVGIARDGDLAVLAWPTPSCCDQLTHLASNALDARDQPRTGVREGFGAALGFVIRTAAGARVQWLHDPSAFRVVSAGYVDADSLAPVGVYEHIATGLRVTLTDAVDPMDDVLQRRVAVRVPTTAGVTEVALLAHTNLGPTLNVVPRLPLGDVLVDARNDFAVVWDDARGAFVHFRPADADPVNDLIQVITAPTLAPAHFGPIDALMRRDGDLRADVNTLAGALDGSFGAGVYTYVGADPRPDAYQAGMEDDGFCTSLDGLIDNVVALQGSGITLPINPALARVFRCPAEVRGDAVPRSRMWTRRPMSAWQDAQDGTLSGSPLAAWRSDTAMRVPVALTGGEGTARLFLAFGRTAMEARTRFERARMAAPDALPTADRAQWRARVDATTFPVAPMRIPEPDRARVTAATRRAYLHVYNGIDAATGMIVASIARQAPYGLDWPRDGAFFDYALDVAGQHAATTRRLAWALPLARREPVLPNQIFALTDPAPPLDPRTNTRQYPEAAWEMNYYNTGAMGGFFRFEIDNTAWMVWSAAAHVAFVPEADRRRVADGYWETVRRSADLLAAWRDAQTGLPAPANEDDNAAFTATLHGGTSVFAALEASARLARFTAHEADAARWERRASELRDALIRNFYDPQRGRFINDVTGAAASNPGSSTLGATAWLVWPARLLPYSDPRVARQVRYDLEQVLASLRGDMGTEGGAYLTKTTLAAAAFLAGGGDRAVEPLLDEAMTRLARDVIDPDTQTMGEVFITLRDAAGRVTGRENRVSIPHLWEATLYALSVAAMGDPARFNLDLSPLPAAQTPPPGTVPFTPPPAPDAGMTADASAPFDGGGMDAAVRPTPTAEGGCGCHTGSERTSLGSWALVALAGLAARRRRSAR